MKLFHPICNDRRAVDLVVFFGGLMIYGCFQKSIIFTIHLFIGFSIINIYKPSILGVKSPYFWFNSPVVLGIRYP